MGDALTIVSLVVGGVSVVLGVLAIWLSLVFYRFSDEVLHDIREVSSRVELALGRVDERVHGLESDTFSLVRDTVGDMRGVLFARPSEDELKQRVDYQALESEITGLRRELVGYLNTHAQRGDVDQDALEITVEEILRRSADAGRESRRGVVKALVVQMLASAKPSASVEAGTVMATLARDFPFSLVVQALLELVDEGGIVADGTELRPSTRLRLGAVGPTKSAP